MTAIVNRLSFYDNGNPKRERENFQNYKFEDLDLSRDEVPISFFRSDFRGAKMKAVSFRKNNFSNSDFIDCVVIDSHFKECKFRYTEFYNTFFERSNFSELAFSSASFVRIVFKSCEFKLIHWRIDTLRDCQFIQCIIHKSDFEKTSMDEVSFEKVKFKDVDLSTMTGINLYFDKCHFENVIIDADYLGSYFFKGNFPTDLKLKYRGKLIELNIGGSDLLESLLKLLLEKERFYEALNIIVQKGLLEKKRVSIYSVIQPIIEALVSESNILKRTYQIKKLFNLLEYYYNTGYIIIDDYFKIIAFFDELNMSSLTLPEKLDLENSIDRLKSLINLMDMDLSFIESLDKNRLMLLELGIEESAEQTFEVSLNNFLLKLSKRNNLGLESFKIIAKRRGSIIYEIVMYSSLALVFLKILKSAIKHLREISSERIQLIMDYKFSSVMIKQLKNADTIEKMMAAKKTQLQFMGNKGLVPNNLNEDKDLKNIITPLKSAIWHPNALVEGNK